MGPAVSALVGAAGGTLTSADGNLTITVPAGALAADVDLVIQQYANTAPVGQGNLYELSPAGQVFALPVSLAFKNPTLSATTPTATTSLWVSFLVNGAVWLRAGEVTVDGTANTLTTTVTDLGWIDWSVVGSGPNVGNDLVGTFTLVSTLDVPFTATGGLTLANAGADGRATYFFPVGSLTISSPITIGAKTCTPVSASAPVKSTAVVEVRKSASDPVPLVLSIDATWPLTCGAAGSELADTRFDTLGINLGSCTRGFVGVPTLTAAKVQCDAGNACAYVIDCGARGKETATFSFTPCTPGVACTSANACHTAAITCSTGFPVCTDNGNVANGTGCGTNQVCGGGVCNACTQAATCTSTNVCAATATIACGSGFPVCTDQTFVAAGTGCGAGQVCSPAGSCAACSQGATCTPATPNACAASSTIECSSGAPVCTDRTFVAAGTSCGTNQVCSAGGVCGACTQGATCTPATPNACATSSTIECSSGGPVCTDRTFLTAGTSCGAGQVCSAGGACGACSQGATCTPTTPNACATSSTVECSSGAPVCTDRTFVAAGTSCGAGQVCSPAGACTACNQGATCTPLTPNPCAATSTFECSSGGPVCTDRTFVADGTSCGTGLSCNAGACVASRTVTGTRTVTAWPDGGPAAPAPSPELAVVPPSAPVSVAALVADGIGGWITYPGTFPAAGSFSVPGVPVGPYVLRYVDASGFVTLLDATASTVDLGFDQAGRAAPAFAGASTPVTFAVSSLAPWSAAGDLLEVTSSNAGLWDLLAPTPAFGAGATGGDAVDDWFLGNTSGAALPLLAPADVVYLHQLSAAVDATSGLEYRSATASTSITGVAVVGGAPATLTPPAFTALAPLAGSLPAATWSVSAFDLLAAINPAATAGAGAHALAVGASPFPLAAPGPYGAGAPRLALVQVARGTAPDPGLGALPYGKFLPAGWNEWRDASFTARVSYAAPAATPVTLTGSIGVREAMPPAAGAIAPVVGPVSAPTVNGVDAFGTLAAQGLTPTLAWSAPALGAPSRYEVELYQLRGVAGASVVSPVATWFTTARSLKLPPGLLVAGNTYLARITAWTVTSDPLAATPPAPLRLPGVYAWASVLTGTFAP